MLRCNQSLVETSARSKQLADMTSPFAHPSLVVRREPGIPAPPAGPKGAAAPSHVERKTTNGRAEALGTALFASRDAEKTPCVDALAGERRLLEWNDLGVYVLCGLLFFAGFPRKARRKEGSDGCMG